MKDYYAFLGLPRDTSRAEISRIIFSRIEQCEKLASHPKPEIAQMATHALEELKAAKCALLDAPQTTPSPANHWLDELDRLPLPANEPTQPVVIRPAVISQPVAQSKPNRPPIIHSLESALSSLTPPEAASAVTHIAQGVTDLPLEIEAVVYASSEKQDLPILSTSETESTAPLSNPPSDPPVIPDEEAAQLATQVGEPQTTAIASLKDLVVEKLVAPPQEGCCPSCQHINPPQSRYCQRCGSQIGKPCPHCRVVNQISALHCCQCGFDYGAHEKAQNAMQKQAQNAQRIQELTIQVAQEKANLEDWKDAHAGSFRNQGGDVARQYARICASNTVPNLWWLWILLSIGVAVFCGLVLQIPEEIALYIGLGVALPAGLAALRAGGGCYVSLGVWAIGGAMAAAVIAWGSQFMIGILCGLLAMPVIYLLGTQIAESNNRNTIQELVAAELRQTEERILSYEREMRSLSN